MFTADALEIESTVHFTVSLQGIRVISNDDAYVLTGRRKICLCVYWYETELGFWLNGNAMSFV